MHNLNAAPIPAEVIDDTRAPWIAPILDVLSLDRAETGGTFNVDYSSAS
ncbi:hypothetical protein [Brevundimonas sp.]|nr:hypothetical protein [Brevundimonas sp.]MDZ4363092.1 hypothetical protein [Brevundimonas sp.]